MNIFLLDKDPKICAQYHCNLHVIKMILEYAQLLSSAHHILDNSRNVNLYRLTHKDHPCSIWSRESRQNYEFLYTLFIELSNEYTYRYGKTHITYLRLKDDLKIMPKNIQNLGLTEFVKCMPDNIKSECPIQSYRDFYIYDKADKFKMEWKKREIPFWFKKEFKKELQKESKE